jgi:hypothetical protein
MTHPKNPQMTKKVAKPAMQKPNQFTVSKYSSKSVDTALASYAAAISDPFSDLAIGAQVPDMYSYPTSTARAEGTIILNSNGAGVASVLIGAHPYLSMIDMAGCYGSSGMNAWTTSTTAFGATSYGALSGLLQNYRVVGGGIEIRNLMAPTAAVGRCIAAKIPAIGPVPSANILDNIACLPQNLSGLYCNIAPATATAGYSGDLLEFPEAQEFTMQDLITNCLEINFKPTSPEAFRFHGSQTRDSVNATVNLGAGSIVTASTGVVIDTYDNSSNMEVEGFDCILLLFNGLPATTASVVEIKYIYHLEGSPLQSTSAGALAPAAKAVSHVNPLGHAQVLSKVLNNPTIKLAAKAISLASQVYFTPERAAATMMAKLGLTL